MKHELLNEVKKKREKFLFHNCSYRTNFVYSYTQCIHITYYTIIIIFLNNFKR